MSIVAPTVPSCPHDVPGIRVPAANMNPHAARSGGRPKTSRSLTFHRENAAGKTVRIAFQVIDVPQLPPDPLPPQDPTPAPAPAPTPTPTPVPAGALNVRDFGARGDGVTNDRPAIQAALDRFIHHPEGGAVYFPAGTYLLADDAIKIRGDNTRLIGEGSRSVLVHGLHVGCYAGPEALPSHGNEIRLLTFVGKPGSYKKDGNEGVGILIFGGKGVIIDSCEFRGCGYPVINAGRADTTYGTQITNCQVFGWGSVGFFLNGGEVVRNCQLIQDDPDRLGERSSHGLYIHSGAHDILVEDVLIQNARKYGCQVYGQDESTSIERVTFRRLILKDTAFGFTVNNYPVDAARVKGLLFEDCQFLGTYNGQALQLLQGDAITVRQCLFDGGSMGIALGRWESWGEHGWISNVRIENNTIRNCETGIYALASYGGHFENVVLTGNQITQCPTSVNLNGATGIAGSDVDDALLSRTE
jgi:hypothetical protein